MSHDDMSVVFERIVYARHSVRGFLPGEVAQDVLEKIFTLAQTAPSNCNTQPWLVHVASGEVCHSLRNELTAAVLRGDFCMDFPYEGKYSGVYKERQHDAASQLYAAMGIARDDKPGRNAAFLRNFSFFDAPHVAFLFMPEGFGVREAADVGMYAQNLMLAMAAFGVASCPQTALAFHAGIVRERLGIAAEQKLLLGISFGYEDKSVAANAARVGRSALASVLTFHR